MRDCHCLLTNQHWRVTVTSRVKSLHLNHWCSALPPPQSWHVLLTAVAVKVPLPPPRYSAALCFEKYSGAHKLPNRCGHYGTAEKSTFMYASTLYATALLEKVHKKQRSSKEKASKGITCTKTLYFDNFYSGSTMQAAQENFNTSHGPHADVHAQK